MRIDIFDRNNESRMYEVEYENYRFEDKKDKFNIVITHGNGKEVIFVFGIGLQKKDYIMSVFTKEIIGCQDRDSALIYVDENKMKIRFGNNTHDFTGMLEKRDF